MKIKILVSLFGFCAAGGFAELILSPPIAASKPAQPKPLREEIQLLDGDALGGKFLGFDAKQGIRWKHSAIRNEVTIDPAKVRRIVLHRLDMPKAARHHASRVTLRNGDRLAGDLVTLKDGKLTLDTWYAGKLALPQAALQKLIPGQPGQTLLAGSDAYKGWVITGANGANGEIFKANSGVLPEEILKRIYAQNQKTRDPAKTGWAVEGMSLVNRGGTGVIGREIPFAEGTQIEFDVKSAEKDAFSIFLFSNDLRSSALKKGFCFALMGNGQFVFTTDAIPALNSKISRVDGIAKLNHVNIQIAPRSGKFILTLNNHIRLTAPESMKFVPEGKGLVFRNLSNNSLQISNLRVSRWNGEAREEKPGVAHQGKKDLVELSNADRMQGQLLGIAEGKLRMQSDLGNLPMPLERVQAIHFGQPKTKAPAAARGGVRLKLKDGGVLTGELLEWKKGVVKVKSATLGEVTLNGGMVSGIEFVLNGKKTAKVDVPKERKLVMPDILFVEDDLADFDGIPEAWLKVHGGDFPRLKNLNNLPKLDR